MLLCEAGPHGPTLQVRELVCEGEQACMNCVAELEIKSGSTDSWLESISNALLLKFVQDFELLLC